MAKTVKKADDKTPKIKSQILNRRGKVVNIKFKIIPSKDIDFFGYGFNFFGFESRVVKEGDSVFWQSNELFTINFDWDIPFDRKLIRSHRVRPGLYQTERFKVRDSLFKDLNRVMRFKYTIGAYIDKDKCVAVYETHCLEVSPPDTYNGW